MRSYRFSVLCGAILTSALAGRATSQVADYYRGTVINSELSGNPAVLEFVVLSRTDSATTGYLKVGKPLSGSGFSAAVPRDLDSLYLITITTAGDTIVWASPTRNGIICGQYWIKGAQFGGQGG